MRIFIIFVFALPLVSSFNASFLNDSVDAPILPNHDLGPACIGTVYRSSPPKLDCLRAISQLSQPRFTLALSQTSRLDKTSGRCRIWSEMVSGVESDDTSTEMLYLAGLQVIMACEGSGGGSAKVGTGFTRIGVGRGIQIWIGEAQRAAVTGVGGNDTAPDTLAETA